MKKKVVSNQQVIIKFKTAGSDNLKPATADRLNMIVGHHAFKEVQPLFPGDSDREMASVYVATVAGDPSISEILDSLNGRSEIDYAHLPAERKGM